MIVVHINKENFEYDLHSLVKAFYPKEKVSVFAGEKKLKEEASQEFFVEYKESSIAIRLSEELQGEVEVDASNRTDCKNRLKKLFYQLLEKHTKKSLPWGTLTGIRPTKIPMKLLQEGKSEADIRAFMQEVYLCSEEKTQLSIDIAKRELAIMEQIDYEDGYSLYVGIPFCPSTCLYCSFTSYPLGLWKDKVDAYLDALEKEIDYVAEAFRDRTLNTIYIGGGTPTTLSPTQMDRLLTKLEKSLDLSHLKELTVEAGRPDSIDRAKLEVLKAHQVSRISVNPQTMKDETLKIIGRHHTVSDIKNCFALARELGFENINMDLILGLPGESLQDVKETMEEVRKLAPNDVTVHSLAVKRGSRLYEKMEQYQTFAMENTEEQVDITAKVCQEMGLKPYYLYRQKNMAGNFENVGYAADGKAGIYNILIMEEVQTIVACGAGTVTKRVDPDGRIERCDNVKELDQYMERIDEMIDRKRTLFQNDMLNQ